jgi:hypothetical protein
VMESFLVQLMNSPNSPVANAGKAIFFFRWNFNWTNTLN